MCFLKAWGYGLKKVGSVGRDKGSEGSLSLGF